VIPRWYLNAEGLAAIKARAAALRDYLRLRRQARVLLEARWKP
jgi:hypothetical protein